MNTWGAFAMGEANRETELMVFDWNKAARLIIERKPKCASAGLRSDWEYTGGTIYKDGKPVMDDYTYLASTLAVPELDMDGDIVECFRMEHEVPGWGSNTKWPKSALDILSAEEMEMLHGKKILDVTCGARSIWFNKHHPAAVYCDKRREQYHHLWKNAGNCTLDINPDVVCDFTNLPFPDNSFPLVVFDPPHLTGAKETAWLVKKYGKLDENWPQMLHDGFQECMRVLKPDGVLIFKWSEHDIPAAEVWKAIGQKPLFGHHSGKQSRTFWGCFMKLEEMEMLEGME